MKGAHYVIHVEHDPTGTYSKGARFPIGEFLIGVHDGVFPDGMKVSKRAATSEFRVHVTKHGDNFLTDNHNDRWSVRKNGGNSSGFQMRYIAPLHKRKPKK